MGFATQPPLLPEIFALHAKWRSVDAAVCVDNSIWTWAEFMADCHQFGHGLRAIGLMEGDRVGILMSNGYPMLQVIFGAIAAGWPPAIGSNRANRLDPTDRERR